MKKTLILLTLFAFSLNYLSAQQDSSFVKASFDGDINKYFGSKLDFPRNLASQNIQGKTVISFQIDKKGELNSIFVENFPHIELAKDAVAILSSTKGSWKPTLKNNLPIDFEYKIIINYQGSSGNAPSKEESLVLKDKAERKFKKEDFEKALSLMNDAIELNPYTSDYYQSRSKIYLALNNEGEAALDQKRAIEFDRKIMTNIYIVAYSVVKKVSRTTNTVRRM